MSESIPQMRNAIVIGELLVGGTPSPDHLEEAHSQGYSVFIDLRSVGESGVTESREALARLQAYYLHIPVAGSAGLTRENAIALDRALVEATGPTVVFCASGNRVGALLALRAHWLQGASPEQALQIGREAGLTSLEAMVAGHLGLRS